MLLGYYDYVGEEFLIYDYFEAAKGYWCPVSGEIEKNETQEEADS